MTSIVPRGEGLDPFEGIDVRDLPPKVFIPFEVAAGARSVLEVEARIRGFLDQVLERGYGWRLDEDLPRMGWMLTLTAPGTRQGQLR